MSQTTTDNSKSQPEQTYQLQCMEIVGGNETTQNGVTAPGLDIWVDSRPVQGNVGGDVHYFSMCGSGRVTRLALADVSGHGPRMDHAAKWLRSLMRKHINLLDQTKLAREVNREVEREAGLEYFVTVLLITYFAPTDHLIICNAGHPSPVRFNRSLSRWQPLTHDLPDTGPSIREAKGTYRLTPVANLPLGIVEPTDYHQFDVKLNEGDLVVAYTDAFTEAANPQGTPLGETGLLDILEKVEPGHPKQVAAEIRTRVDEYRGHAPPQDDQTIVVLYHNASEPEKITVGGAVKSIAKMIGLLRV